MYFWHRSMKFSGGAMEYMLDVQLWDFYDGGLDGYGLVFFLGAGAGWEGVLGGFVLQDIYQ